MRRHFFDCLLLASVLGTTHAQTTLHAVHGTTGPSVSGNGAGMVAAFAGDANADGFDDWIVGIPEDDAFGTNSGLVRVHSGADGSVLHALHGSQQQRTFGAVVDGVGDVNADGFDDVIVGVDSALSTNGAAFVHSGADGSVLFTIALSPTTLNLDVSVTGAGDLNGDGRPDFALGIPHADEVPANADDKGCVRAYSGVDGSSLFEVFGSGVVTGLGYRLDAAGDVNGDGFDDLIASAIDIAISGEANGEVRVLSGVDGSTLRVLSAATPVEWFGSSCAGVGDVTGDGRPDLLVGVQFDSSVAWRAGAARLYSGTTGALLASFHGNASGARLGASVAGLGDIDGDGVPDLAIGAPRAPLGPTSNGSVTIVSGRARSVLFPLHEDAPGDELGNVVALGGDTDGDGRSELLTVAPGDDAGGYQTGTVRVVTLSPPACVAATSYCTAAPNSTGTGSAIHFSGTTSVAANDLFLHAFPGPAEELGRFFVGPTQVALPFGNGLRCVGGGLRRLPLTQFGWWGGAGSALDNNAPPLLGLITPGSTWCFQLFYEDPGTGAGFNTSDALRVEFCP